MNPKIIAKIDSLPPLPQTAVEIDAFKNKTDKNPPRVSQNSRKRPFNRFNAFKSFKLGDVRF